jgi:arylformamidase
MIIDITRAVRATTAVFPGDTPYRADPLLRLAAGSAVNLVTLTTTPHVGTHADAPFHTLHNGAHPIDLPIEPYIGAARVISVGRRHGAITRDDLPADLDLRSTPRVLLRTWYSELDDAVWDDSFPYPDAALITWLAGCGVVLIGLDTPSFDAADSRTLPGHAALWRHGMFNLENLLLRGVPDGVYELIALPLRLDAACASPVRAILRSFSGA